MAKVVVDLLKKIKIEIDVDDNFVEMCRKRSILKKEYYIAVDARSMLEVYSLRERIAILDRELYNVINNLTQSIVMNESLIVNDYGFVDKSMDNEMFNHSDTLIKIIDGYHRIDAASHINNKE
jgi:hypothetical protein